MTPLRAVLHRMKSEAGTSLIEVTIATGILLVVMAGMMGIQSILLGLIAELLVRTYHESQDKPTYTVRKVWREGKETK